MDISVRLIELTIMHPPLLWEAVTADTMAMLSHAGDPAPSGRLAFKALRNGGIYGHGPCNCQ